MFFGRCSISYQDIDQVRITNKQKVLKNIVFY